MTVVLVGAPRSGASLLAALLTLDPAWSRGTLDDTSLDAAAGIPASAETSVVWNPRLSLRLPEVAAALPDARFVLMVRRPVPTIASLMEAWRSRRFVSERELPGWWGEPWSFPLITDWEALIGAPPAQVCAAQWTAITTAVLDGLEGITPERWTVASYEALTQDPTAEVARVSASLGIPWAAEVPDPLPLTATVVSRPSPSKWARQWSEIATQMNAVEPVADRLRQVASERRSDLPWPELERPMSQSGSVTTLASNDTPFSSVHTPSLPQLLGQAGASLLITTYKSGHAIIARDSGGTIDTEFKHLSRPMGVAVAGRRLAIGASDVIMAFTANPGLSARVASPRPVDLPYAPRSIVFTGDVAIHDMEYGADGALYFVNTRFSCLSRQDIDYSFVPVWRPAWISGLAAEDRCHLNGLCMVEGRPRYVTALSQTDHAHGWRALKGTSGVIVDITDDRVVASGLSMPHSPRWHDGRLWVLESGKGTLATVDVESGDVTTVATLPGFTRGLSFIGPYALVGLSQVRESVFSSLPITEQAAERNCGVWAVDTRDGSIVGFLKFDGVVQEIFDVRLLPGRWPSILDAGEITQSAFVLPDEALGDVVQEAPAAGPS